MKPGKINSSFKTSKENVNVYTKSFRRV
jgi:hypothetical protein